MIIDDLKIGDTIENKKIAHVFQCSNQGGIRKSKKTKTVVIIAKFTDCLYKHRKEKKMLYFTGIGKIGDQEMTRQNKSLLNAKTEGFDVHAFFMEKEGEYIYKGKVEIAGEPFNEKQLDNNGNKREVIIFPFKYLNKLH